MNLIHIVSTTTQSSSNVKTIPTTTQSSSNAKTVSSTTNINITTGKSIPIVSTKTLSSTIKCSKETGSTMVTSSLKVKHSKSTILCEAEETTIPILSVVLETYEVCTKNYEKCEPRIITGNYAYSLLTYTRITCPNVNFEDTVIIVAGSDDLYTPLSTFVMGNVNLNEKTTEYIIKDKTLYCFEKAYKVTTKVVKSNTCTTTYTNTITTKQNTLTSSTKIIPSITTTSKVIPTVTSTTKIISDNTCAPKTITLTKKETITITANASSTSTNDIMI